MPGPFTGVTTDSALQALKDLWARGAQNRAHPLDRLGDPREVIGVLGGGLAGAGENAVPAAVKGLGQAAPAASMGAEFAPVGGEAAFNATRPAAPQLPDPMGSSLDRLMGGQKAFRSPAIKAPEPAGFAGQPQVGPDVNSLMQKVQAAKEAKRLAEGLPAEIPRSR